MNSKFKYHQSVKVEKENQNVKLRKKSKGLATDKHLINKKETVWDRLSKTKKVSCSEKVSEEHIRSGFIAKTRHRFQPVDRTSLKQRKQTSKKPLLVQTNNTVKKHLGISHNPFSKKPKHSCESRNDILAFEGITTSRSLSSDSKYSSESDVGILKFQNYCSNQRGEDFPEASIAEYTLAPLLASCSEDRVSSNFGKYFPNNNNSTTFGNNDLKLNVAQSASRDEVKPKLPGDSLQTRLEGTFVRELNDGRGFPEHTSKMIEYSNHKYKIGKLQVDVSFKSTPSLHKEIEILRALGEKLEATIKNSNIHRNKLTFISQVPANSTSKPTEVSEKRNRLLLLKVKRDFKTEHLALVSIELSGIRQCVGIINEFFVAKKTIVELKREASSNFFIPSYAQNIQLMKSSFKNLKKNPSELLRHVKSKNSQIAFNVLEQDPIFFYSCLGKSSKFSRLALKNHNKNKAHRLAIEQCADTFTGTGSTSKDEESHSDRNCLIGKNESEKINNFLEMQIVCDPLIRGEKRRRTRHLTTPMPIGYYHCPKNSVIKSILVGFVQVSLFIVFIAALIHPSLKCLDSSVYQ